MRLSFFGGTILFILFWLFGMLLFGLIGELLKGFSYLQLMVVQVGIWLFPALLYARLFFDDFWNELRLKNVGKPIDHGRFILFYFVSIPLVGYLVGINENIVFQESLATLEQWFREKEHQSRDTVLNVLSEMSSTDLLWVLLALAVFPAICEEVFFRGVVLTNLLKRTSNIHLSVWLSAILFSAVHLQFFGFFPRIIMGVVFGYAFVLSKSLWLPIILHFLNNAILVVAYYFSKNDAIVTNPTEIATIPIWLAVVSLVFSSALLKYFLLGTSNKPKIKACD